MKLKDLMEAQKGETIPADADVLRRLKNNSTLMIKIKNKNALDANPDNDDDVIKLKASLPGSVNMTTLKKIAGDGGWANKAELEVIVANFLAMYGLTAATNPVKRMMPGSNQPTETTTENSEEK